MNRIRRIRSPLARLTRLPGTLALRASQLTGQAAHLSGRSGRDGFARRFIQDVAATASVAAGHQPVGEEPRATRPPSVVPSAGSAGQHCPASATTRSQWQTVAARSLLPRTIQLCTHCRQNPAGFWVSGTSGQTVRRPWCLSCCQQLDRDHCDVIPFDS